MPKGAQHALQQLIEDHRVWALLATVDQVSNHSAWGILLDVTFQPSGIQGQTRFKQLGAGQGQSATVGVSVGDEVLVVFPGGDINDGVALSGLVSKAAPLGTMESLLKANTFLADLTACLTELQAAATAIGVPTTNTAAMIVKLELEPSPYKTTAMESE